MSTLIYLKFFLECPPCLRPVMQDCVVKEGVVETPGILSPPLYSPHNLAVEQVVDSHIRPLDRHQDGQTGLLDLAWVHHQSK